MLKNLYYNDVSFNTNKGIITKKVIRVIKTKFKFNSLVKNAGRNNTGRIMVYSKLGGSKRLFIKYDNFRVFSYIGMLVSIITTGLRTAKMGLIYTNNGLFNIIILTHGFFLWDRIEGFSKEDFYYLGSSSFLLNAFLGMWVNNIEIKPGLGVKFIKAAGTGGFVYNVDRNKLKVVLKLSSGWLYFISAYCVGVKGFVNTFLYNKINFKKAGFSRKLGFKSIVRGVAMNPVDHPHGGGEGKKSPRVSHKTPWGKLTKGVNTKMQLQQQLKRKLYKKNRRKDSDN